jgi:DHA3 family tetracycline resistance protein-like MFS transporter
MSLYEATVAGLHLTTCAGRNNLELSAFIFEVPTGVVADAIRAGYLSLSDIMGVGLLVAVFCRLPTDHPCQVIWGLGYTFTSGAFKLTRDRGDPQTGYSRVPISMFCLPPLEWL